MKTTLLAIVSICLVCCIAGCATAPSQTYRPRNYDGPVWVIVCKGEIGLIDMPFEIKINGETVIKDKFSDFQRHADYQGTYEGHQITASFARGYNDIQVIVFVDGERAATF